MNPVKDHKGAQLYIGINYSGTLTVQGSRKIHHFRWLDIQKINYEGKMFIVHLNYDEKKHTTRFNCPFGAACKYVWRCAVEQMLFFRMSHPLPVNEENNPSTSIQSEVFSRPSGSVHACQHASGTISAQASQSTDKPCGICLETLAEKKSSDRRYGILNRCNHVFCHSCIRKWRRSKRFKKSVVESCPLCRVRSEFVCPSDYWVETEEDKDKLIKCYKQGLATKPCKYFKQGLGECPFMNKCLYLHALPDGTRTDVGPPMLRVPLPPPQDNEVLNVDQIMTLLGSWF